MDYYRAVAQPILTAADEKIVGHEQISRGQEGPYAMPSEFFRIATESDMLTEVDLTCAAVCMPRRRSSSAEAPRQPLPFDPPR